MAAKTPAEPDHAADFAAGKLTLSELNKAAADAGAAATTAPAPADTPPTPPA